MIGGLEVVRTMPLMKCQLGQPESCGGIGGSRLLPLNYVLGACVGSSRVWRIPRSKHFLNIVVDIDAAGRIYLTILEGCCNNSDPSNYPVSVPFDFSAAFPSVIHPCGWYSGAGNFQSLS